MEIYTKISLKGAEICESIPSGLNILNHIRFKHSILTGIHHITDDLTNNNVNEDTQENRIETCSENPQWEQGCIFPTGNSLHSLLPLWPQFQNMVFEWLVLSAARMNVRFVIFIYFFAIASAAA